MIQKNKTISAKKLKLASNDFLILDKPTHLTSITNQIINQDIFETIKFLPENFVDLLFIDPPYNLTKHYHNHTFKEMNISEYQQWIESWFQPLIKTLKPTASVYICCDWKSSIPVYNILSKYLKIRNRITWEREKGRGALHNWKNNSEDIWFATVSDNYYFNSTAVKLLKKVIAPYKNSNNTPKDWFTATDGNHYRLTYPSNIWTDITIPFWSMPENTDHPTQKPEKLLAKIILASSKENDFILDPFMGSGTTIVTAKKLHRKFCGIEINPTYCSYAQKRLQDAEQNSNIQGYYNGIFLERNTNISKIPPELFTLNSE